VLSRFESRDDDLFVEMRRRRNDDGVCRVFAKHSPVVFEYPRAAWLRRGLRPGCIGVGNRFEPATWHAPQRRRPQPPDLSRPH
jgi:hypothetical protein